MKFIGFFLLMLCSFQLKLMAQAPVGTQQTNNAVTQNTADVPLKIAPVKRGKNDTIKVYSTSVDGILTPWIVIPEVKIVAPRIFVSQQARDDYYRLRYNVYKVMPYAKFASERYAQLQRDLALTSDKRKQKELVKACETQIKDLFKREVENLTISQGEILIKLIDRQTGNTSYDMVKDLKGGWNAFMFQSIARIFGHNLKETYDPTQERDIESILQQAGYDSSYNN